MDVRGKTTSSSASSSISLITSFNDTDIRFSWAFGSFPQPPYFPSSTDRCDKTVDRVGVPTELGLEAALIEGVLLAGVTGRYPSAYESITAFVVLHIVDSLGEFDNTLRVLPILAAGLRMYRRSLNCPAKRLLLCRLLARLDGEAEPYEGSYVVFDPIVDVDCVDERIPPDCVISLVA